MLHPSYKTAYFKRLKWPTEWIDAADEVVHSEWYTRYAHIVIDPAEVVEEATATAAHQVCHPLDEVSFMKHQVRLYRLMHETCWTGPVNVSCMKLAARHSSINSEFELPLEYPKSGRYCHTDLNAK